jgi:hypothetical protein
MLSLDFFSKEMFVSLIPMWHNIVSHGEIVRPEDDPGGRQALKKKKPLQEGFAGRPRPEPGGRFLYRDNGGPSLDYTDLV